VFKRLLRLGNARFLGFRAGSRLDNWRTGAALDFARRRARESTKRMPRSWVKRLSQHEEKGALSHWNMWGLTDSNVRIVYICWSTAHGRAT